MEGVVIDLRRAARRLHRSPGFTAVTVISLALGIGASTAILSAVRPVLLDTLPYPRADRLVVIADAGGTAGSSIDVTFGTFREVLARSRSLQSGAVVRGWQPTLTGFGQAARLDGESVTAGYFRALGVSPALGRNFSDADDVPAAAPVAIISDRLWHQLFGADRSLIGGPVTLDGAAVTLIGVMPPAFENVWNPEARIWRPLGYDPSLPLDGREWGHHLKFLARIRPDVSVAAATRELASIAQTPLASMPRPASASLNSGFTVTPLQDLITTPVKPALEAVLLATFLLLLIAAVNVVHLTLARGAERRSELAICGAFGASRVRLLSPLLAEGTALASVGGILGVALAYAMVAAIVRMDGFTLPRVETIHVDRTALVFAAALSAGIGLVAGCVPALSWWSRVAAPIAGRRSITGHQRLRRAFVVAEVSLALVLLVGAGLLLRTLDRLLAVPLGFHPEDVLTLQIQVAGPQFRGADTIRGYFERVRSAVAAVPGVSSAAVSSQLPLTGDADLYGVGTHADAALPPDADRSAFRYAISPGYLVTLGIPLEAGRDLDARDRSGTQPVALISDSFRRRRFPGRSAIGEQIRIGGADVRFTVVGITGDVRQTSLVTAPAEAVYVPEPQWHFADRAMWIVLRTNVDPLTLEPAVRRAIAAIDANQPIVRVATLEQRVHAATAVQRFVMTAFGAFAAVALLLATIGIYGILAGGVVERTREIAVRAAVGASRGAIVGLVARQAFVVTAIGITIGSAVAVALSRMLAGLMFKVALLDAATYASVGGVLLIAAAIGATVPAWRAARIAPAVALHSE